MSREYEFLRIDLEECRSQGVKGFRVCWGAADIGFGELEIFQSPEDGRLHCHDETMGKEFVKALLSALVDRCELV